MKLRTMLARIKRKLLKKPFLKDPRFPPYWINRQLKGRPAFLVQIGSNDGKTGDPFYPLLRENLAWQALFVEPVPLFFERLKENYPDPARFSFENAAINEGGSLEFYWLDPKMYREFPDLPYWYEQLGSLDREHIVRQVDPKVLPFLTSTPVQGLPLSELLIRHQVRSMNILHIDAEGYDWKILSQLDLNRYRPDFILYEYHHLHPDEQRAAADFLKAYYAHFRVGIDAFAVRKDLGEDFIREMTVKLHSGNK